MLLATAADDLIIADFVRCFFELRSGGAGAKIAFESLIAVER
ncbi:MAG: hypothetical protein ETSY2_38330 [Candidatus Entotheonella gemina]|uniref:Uncharacterized protein n=1 Tax=Candidatus Entotheonella gemina TaxID=1429439 RepID=W4LS42_9BACT|nr:MAG: hypothetical protein ETSY2_38330 [Candidatus Entotheonella gemina]